jgi:hypothetical protein
VVAVAAMGIVALVAMLALNVTNLVLFELKADTGSRWAG